MAGRFIKAKEALVTYAKVYMRNPISWNDDETEEVQYGRDFDHLVEETAVWINENVPGIELRRQAELQKVLVYATYEYYLDYHYDYVALGRSPYTQEQKEAPQVPVGTRDSVRQSRHNPENQPSMQGIIDAGRARPEAYPAYIPPISVSRTSNISRGGYGSDQPRGDSQPRGRGSSRGGPRYERSPPRRRDPPWYEQPLCGRPRPRSERPNANYGGSYHPPPSLPASVTDPHEAARIELEKQRWQSVSRPWLFCGTAPLIEDRLLEKQMRLHSLRGE